MFYEITIASVKDSLSQEKCKHEKIGKILEILLRDQIRKVEDLELEVRNKIV